MTDQPEGMFSDLRLVDGGSVVTCTPCGSLVADIEAHRRMHQDMVTLADLAALTRGSRSNADEIAQWLGIANKLDRDANTMTPPSSRREDRGSTTESDAALFEHRRGQAYDS